MLAGVPNLVIIIVMFVPLVACGILLMITRFSVCFALFVIMLCLCYYILSVNR